MTVTVTFTAANGATQQITLANPSVTAQPAGLCALLSQNCAISQNSGISNTTTRLYPLGVPSSYDWYIGCKGSKGAQSPPAGFTSLNGWGQVYPQATGFGSSTAMGNPACQIYMTGWKTYAHLKTGGWSLEQDQTTMDLQGSHYPANFQGSNLPATWVKQADGSVRVDSPPNGYNNHFWPGPRGQYVDGTVDGVFVVVQMRVDNAAANLIVNMGCDWWLSTSAPYIQPETNNPGAGMSSWLKLTTSYQYCYFTTMTAALMAADPPPPLVGRP